MVYSMRLDTIVIKSITTLFYSASRPQTNGVSCCRFQQRDVHPEKPSANVAATIGGDWRDFFKCFDDIISSSADILSFYVVISIHLDYVYEASERFRVVLRA